MRRSTMKVKLIISMIAISAILVACSAPDETSDSQLVVYGVAGNITELTSNDNGTMTILVEGDLATNGADYDRGYVTVNDDTVIYLDEEVGMEALEEGQYVNVFFQGDVMESYPIQATARQINIIPEDPINS